MFKFNFDIDDPEDHGVTPVTKSQAAEEPQQTQGAVAEDAAREVSLEQLVSFSRPTRHSLN